MRLVDSHAHIYLKEFSTDLDDVLSRSQEAGVEKIYMPNIDHSSIDDMLRVNDQHPEYCLPMMGLHPCSVKRGFEKELYLVEDWLKKDHFVAVGEIGTDLYWDKSFWKEQKEALKIQLEFAKRFKLPFAIHCRESIDETIELIKETKLTGLSGVFHCFTGSLKQAKEITDMGFMLGIGGVATFKNGGLGEVLEKIDLKKLLLETDSPYLAPVPHRGKRNEPAYTKLVCEKIAEIKNLEPQEVAEATTNNAYHLFQKKVG